MNIPQTLYMMQNMHTYNMQAIIVERYGAIHLALHLHYPQYSLQLNEEVT